MNKYSIEEIEAILEASRTNPKIDIASILQESGYSLDIDGNILYESMQSKALEMALKDGLEEDDWFHRVDPPRPAKDWINDWMTDSGKYEKFMDMDIIIMDQTHGHFVIMTDSDRKNFYAGNNEYDVIEKIPAKYVKQLKKLGLIDAIVKESVGFEMVNEALDPKISSARKEARSRISNLRKDVKANLKKCETLRCVSKVNSDLKSKLPDIKNLVKKSDSPELTKTYNYTVQELAGLVKVTRDKISNKKVVNESSLEFVSESAMKMATESLERLEECMSDLMLADREDNDHILRQIQRILTLLFEKDFVVDICNNANSEYFGINVFPGEQLCDSVVSAILINKSRPELINELWSMNKEWYIEIDSLLLDDMSLSANSQEMVALLLHEIGHTVYANSVPQRLFNIMRFELTNIHLRTRYMLENNKFRKLMNVVVLQACGDNYYRPTEESEKSEADKFIDMLGYGDHMNSFINKLIVNKGTSALGDKRDLDSNVSIITVWALDNINELHKRKTKLRHELNNLIVKSSSMYTKRFVKSLKNIFFGEETGSKYRKIVLETALDNTFNSESKKADKLIVQEMTEGQRNKSKPIENMDIVYIKSMIDKIQNHSDKITLFELIQKVSDRIDFSIERINDGEAHLVPESLNVLKSYKEELERIKEEITNTKTLDMLSSNLFSCPSWIEVIK